MRPQQVNNIASTVLTKSLSVPDVVSREITHGQTPLPKLVVSYPFTYHNNSRKSADDIYIQIIGTDPVTGLQCYIQYDSQGAPTYVDAKAGLIGTDYSYPLSSFAVSPDGSGYTINLPELNGGRVYTSIEGKMPSTVSWAPGIQQYLIVPNLSTALVMDKSEFTINSGDLYINPTAADNFSLPISVEETAKDGKSQKGGISTVSREKIFSEMSSELAKAGEPWGVLMSKTPPIIHSPVNAAQVGLFPQDYFQTSGFLDAFGTVFSNTPLLVNAGESFPNTGVFKGVYNAETAKMTLTGSFQGESTSVILKIPNTTSDILNGNGSSWNILSSDPKEVQALKEALARNISTAIET
ncbi:MAG: hypothetical protein HRU43_07575, partial [Simkaniaceae bacterium]|nr:hypothetical protein [Simkaniaceae bacterium]